MKVLSTQAHKLAKEILSEISKNGSESASLVKMLMDFRQFFIECEDPTVTKVLRLTSEHLQSNGSFKLNIRTDVTPVVEDDENLTETEDALEEYSPSENLAYLVGLCLDASNKYNREELFEIRDALMAY